MTRARLIASSFAALLFASPAFAQEITVDMNKISAEGVGEQIGTVRASEAQGGGLSFEVAVRGLPAGEHGFHIHQNGDCGPGEKDGQQQAGIAAGEHLDPHTTGTHAGPEGEGHLGDLPKLQLTEDGTAVTVSAPRLKMADIQGKSLMIHEGGDTYSEPPASGGGGARIACGVVGQ